MYNNLSLDGARSSPSPTPACNVRSDVLIEQLPEHPVVTMPPVTRLLATSKQTAGKAIELLIAAGILAEVGARQREPLYPYENYLKLLE